MYIIFASGNQLTIVVTFLEVALQYYGNEIPFFDLVLDLTLFNRVLKSHTRKCFLKFHDKRNSKSSKSLKQISCQTKRIFYLIETCMLFRSNT